MRTDGSTPMAQRASRVALVSGGAGGLGAGICHRLAADGWTVAVNDIDERSIDTLVTSIRARGGDAHAALCDATDERAIVSMVERIEDEVGPIAVTVFNATGPQPNGTVDEVGWNEIVAELEFFAKSPLLLGTAVIPYMRKRRHGRLVHIDSEVVSKVPEGRVAYVTAKSAQVGLARSWALELAAEGITVNTVAPGFVPVERHASISATDIDAYRSTVPVGRMGEVQDIAAAVAFFASDEAAFVTGQRLVVDGGRHLR